MEGEGLMGKELGGPKGMTGSGPKGRENCGVWAWVCCGAKFGLGGFWGSGKERIGGGSER